MEYTDNIAAMIGRIPSEITADTKRDVITFTFEDGGEAQFWHDQGCCESVVIDDVNGDWSDLIGTPLLVAEERVSEEAPDGFEIEWGESNTWTFYTFRSVKGSVDVRWHGSSNGYYSERVDCRVSLPEVTQ